MVEIYGTLGPACADRDTLEQMFRAGLTGMRLNLSHTGLAESGALVENFRQAAAVFGVIPQLLIDMQGPELRIGRLSEPVELHNEDMVVLCGGKSSGKEQGKRGDKVHWSTIPIPLAAVNAMEAGDEVLLDDGKVLLRVLTCGDTCVQAKVLRGGRLTGHKSVKITGKQVELPVLTEHDKANLSLAKAYGVTGLMQPFVRSGKDLVQVRQALKECGAEQVQILAKIETKAAADNIKDILQEADVIVIARGDLGNDMPLWELPAVQKDIERACLQAGKPFIVVTQMLASMEVNPVPTRAEVSDIFNAVADGASGVMITGESAVGRYPVEAVRFLANTAHSAKKWMEKSYEY